MGLSVCVVCHSSWLAHAAKSNESHLAGGTQDATGTAASIVLSWEEIAYLLVVTMSCNFFHGFELPKSLWWPFPSLILPYAYCAGGETEAQHKGSRSPGLVPV